MVIVKYSTNIQIAWLVFIFLNRIILFILFRYFKQLLAMKVIIYSIILSLALFSCSKSIKMLQKGNYDDAIKLSVAKIKKNASNTKEIGVLNVAFANANEIDRNYINKLQKSSSDNKWEEILNTFSKLIQRQEIVKQLPESVLQEINFEQADYNIEIKEAKAKATEFYYKEGLKLLGVGDKKSARKAYDKFLMVKEYSSVYKDVDAKLKQALEKGTNHIIIKLQNQSRKQLPENYENEVLAVSLSDLNMQWVEFHTIYDDYLYYDYSIIINLTYVDISPENKTENKYKESVSTPNNDGSDTLKAPQIIQAYITSIKMNKRSIARGKLDYFDNKTAKLIKTLPVSGDYSFDYEYAIFTGEATALSEKSKELLKNKEKTFPTDMEMILATSKSLKQLVFKIITDDRVMFVD